MLGYPHEEKPRAGHLQPYHGGGQPGGETIGVRDAGARLYAVLPSLAAALEPLAEALPEPELPIAVLGQAEEWTVSDLVLSIAISTAQMLAADYAARLSPSPPTIRIEIEESANPLLDARVVRDGAVCVLRMRRSVLSRSDILAHEACHCVADYELLTPRGYRPEVTKEDARRMEAAAERCEEELTR